ncbi:MAG: hypothetical protein JNK42_04765, partial [Caedimonas sp.]|nr:hypothetical protein [Caedimonas sp.]
MVNIGFLFFINICFLLFSTSHASLQEEDRVTGLYYTGASYQDPASHLPKGYVKDAMDDKLNAALRDAIDESYTKVVQVSFKDNKLFSLNQHRRVLSPLFYLVRRECETTNNAE